MVFYHLLQYGKQVGSHYDKIFSTEKEAREVCRKIVIKAHSLVDENKMIKGAFEVNVCDEIGNHIDNFISDTDYHY